MALCVLRSASLPSLAVCCVPCPGLLPSLPPLRGLSNFCVVLPGSAGSPPPPGSLPRAALPPPPGSLTTRQPLGLCSASLSPAGLCLCPASQEPGPEQPSRRRGEAGLGSSGELRRAAPHPGARPARRAALPSALSSRWSPVLPSLSPPACHPRGIRNERQMPPITGQGPPCSPPAVRGAFSSSPNPDRPNGACTAVCSQAWAPRRLPGIRFPP